VVEQPIRNRQVASSTLALGSTSRLRASSVMVTRAGIRLTRTQRLIYGCSVSAMTRNSESRIETGGATKRAAVCLVLIALLLYNPFFTILSVSQDLSVAHPLSYRATVAGSELRRCTIEPSDPLIPELTAALLHAAVLLAPTHEVAFVQPSDSAGLLSRVSCDSIWFRPPPSA
jgi:hypothetical protein